MYCPEHHRLDDREAVFRLIEAYPLGTWVCAAVDGLAAHHQPFLLDRSAGPHGTLQARVDPTDADALALPAGTPVLVIFRGPQIYITPGWYPGNAEHGRVVPTWNYLVVHAHGSLCWTSDRTGFDIPIHQLQGKLKASQDETRPDREGTVRGLQALGTETARTMATLVRDALDQPHS